MTINRNGVKWTREETILAFDLYCKTPFGKIHERNPDIIELSRLIGRKPSAVGLKMHNLAHFDPELRKRRITAMSHGSKLDEEIFIEFSRDIASLSYEAEIIRAKLQKREVTKLIDLSDMNEIPAGKYRERIKKERIGQYYFRLAVLNSYGGRCCITRLQCAELLIASHIKPWKDSEEKTERTNPCNGLCLNPFHDRAFDRGLITIDVNYRIIVSSQLNKKNMDETTRRWFQNYSGETIMLPDKFLPEKRFIEYHNDVVFQP